MHRPTIQRPTIPTMHRRQPTRRRDRIQGAVHLPHRSQQRRRRGSQPAKGRSAKSGGGRGRASRGRRMLAVTGAGAAIAYFLDRKQGKRRRHMVRDRAIGMARRSRGHHQYDDVTLARKVESEIFRPADAPKGLVNVSAHDGVVELRGQLDRREQIDRLAAAAAQVDGVERVENLLHTPGEPAPHAPAHTGGAGVPGAAAGDDPTRRAGGPMLGGSGQAA
jgi:hypothetical protein